MRSTVETLIDHTYMQNPKPELNAINDEGKKVADLLTTALSSLIDRRNELNLRPHIVKQMIVSHLTNAGCIRLDYQSYEGSRDEAFKLYNVIQEALAKEKVVV